MLPSTSKEIYLEDWSVKLRQEAVFALLQKDLVLSQLVVLLGAI